MEDVGIGEVARRAGVRPSALCYYERVGLLPSPEREGRRRRYGGEVLREVSYRLAVVRVGQQAGFTISKIKTLMDGFSGRFTATYVTDMCGVGLRRGFQGDSPRTSSRSPCPVRTASRKVCSCHLT